MIGSNKNILILGAGESGIGAAILAKKMGWCVYVSDRSEISSENIKTLNDLDVNWEHKSHTYNDLSNINLVVKSPGIPDDIDLIVNLKNRGISVISEIEF